MFASTQSNPGWWHSPTGGGAADAAAMNQWKMQQANSQHANRTWDKPGAWNQRPSWANGGGGGGQQNKLATAYNNWKQKNNQPQAPAPTPQQPIDNGGLPGPHRPAPGFQLGTTQTSITPSTLFSPLDTQMSVNQAAQNTMQDPNYLAKSLMRPGMSRNAGLAGAIAPAMGQGSAAAQRAMQEIPLMDALMNDQFRLQGETARSQEGQSLAELLRRLQNTQDSEGLAQSGMATSLLNGLLGRIL